MTHKIASVVRATAIACAFTVSASLVAVAQDPAPKMPPGPWHYRSIACVNSTVLRVTPRLRIQGQTMFSAADYEATGVNVAFVTRLGVDPLFPKAHASVVHYQGMPGNVVMMAERPGDRVQVCFLSAPTPTQFCNPDRDSRGRLYRIYDYRQKAQYSGENGEHTCGGA